MATLDNPADTSGRLIGASKVNGTSVYSTGGDKLGSIYDVMLDKISGHSEYAILSFGGFLGLGEKYHPLPWSVLTYDPVMGGYVVGLDRAVLEGAPSYDLRDSSLWDDTDWGTKVDDYYGVKDDLNTDIITGRPIGAGAAPRI